MLFLQFLLDFYDDSSSLFSTIAALIHLVREHIYHFILSDSQECEKQRKSNIKNHGEPTDCLEAIYLVYNDVSGITFEIIILHG